MELFSRVESRQKELGLTRKGLSAKTGLYSRTLIDIERGSVPKLPTLEKLSRALGVSLCWLATGRGPRLSEDFDKMLSEWEAAHPASGGEADVR